MTARAAIVKRSLCACSFGDCPCLHGRFFVLSYSLLRAKLWKLEFPQLLKRSFDDAWAEAKLRNHCHLAIVAFSTLSDVIVLAVGLNRISLVRIDGDASQARASQAKYAR